MTNPRKPVPDNGGDNLKRNPLRGASKTAYIEILVPDFRGRLDQALAILAEAPPDVLNHNLETVPRLYKAAHPRAPTRFGLVPGLGERNDEIVAVTRNLRAHGCELFTIGQYLQTSGAQLAVERRAYPDEFDGFARTGHALGFRHMASGPLVRSSCHAERQAHGL